MKQTPDFPFTEAMNQKFNERVCEGLFLILTWTEGTTEPYSRAQSLRSITSFHGLVIASKGF